MDQLVFIENNQVITDSLTIAEMFGKRHDNVMADIRTQIEYAGTEFSLLNFKESNYENRGKWYPKINLTEEAFVLVVFSYNTKEAVQTKIKFIQEFKRMREHSEQINVAPLSKDQALVAVLRTTADLVEDTQTIKSEQQELRTKVAEIDEKIENQITLDHGEQRRLQKAVGQKVYQLEVHAELRPGLFRELYREIKDRFGVASYKDVDAWIPKKAA